MESIDASFPVTAPGCYAAPSVFSHDSEVCQHCPAFDACSSACIETLKALRDKINIEDILTKHRAVKSAKLEAAQPSADEPKLDIAKFLPSVKKPTAPVERTTDRTPKAVHEVPAEMQSIVDGIASKKPRELAAKWCKQGIVSKVRDDLAAGVNPFASQARQNFESVTCDMLLKGVFTKQMLKKAFMAKLGAKEPWDERTAASHVNIILPAMIAFGFAVETAEGVGLHPSLVGHNV